MAKKAKYSPAVYKIPRSLLHVETHYFDFSRGTLAFASTADATGGELDPATKNCLNAIQQGAGRNNRLGNRLLVKRIYITGVVNRPDQEIASNEAGLPAPASVYIALVRDKQTNGAQMNSEDCFTNDSSSSVLASCPLRDTEHLARFDVLKVVRIDFQPAGVSSNLSTITVASGQMVQFTMMVQNMNDVVEYTGTAGTVADISDISYHMIGWTSNTEAAEDITYQGRISFQE